jgi:putative salt-induced outer membrane protein YdiY
LLLSSLLLLSSTAGAAESKFESATAAPSAEVEASKFDISFGGMWSAGNTESATLSASYDAYQRWSHHQLSSKGGVMFGSAVPDTNGDGRLSEDEKTAGRVETASRKEGWLRYDRHLGEKDSFYSLAGGYSDIYAGYDSRLNAQFGYSYRFLEAPEKKGPALTGELGFDAARENAVALVEAVSSEGNVELVYSARALLRFAMDLEEGFAVGQEFESLVNMEAPEDTRVISETSLTAKLTKGLALKFSYKLNYDSLPVEGFSKADQTGLVTVVTSIF